MCGNEPCAHERDYTTAQAMKPYVDASKLAGDAAIERDKALAEVARLRAELAATRSNFRALVDLSEAHDLRHDEDES